MVPRRQAAGPLPRPPQDRRRHAEQFPLTTAPLTLLEATLTKATIYLTQSAIYTDALMSYHLAQPLYYCAGLVLILETFAQTSQTRFASSLRFEPLFKLLGFKYILTFT